MKRLLVSLILLTPLACNADFWMPFYGTDKSGRSIVLDVPDDGSSVVVTSSFRKLPTDLYWARNEDVNQLQTNIRISAAKGDETYLFAKQECEWTLHSRNATNPKRPRQLYKDIVKSSLYCDRNGQSPIAGSYYEARRNSGKYICIQNCAKNPFKVLQKDAHPKEF